MPQLAPIAVATLTAGGAGVGAGLSVFASTALTVGGSLVAGIGKGMMEKKQLKEMEEQDIRAEQRRQASYAGVGAATRIWDKEQASPLKNSASVAPSSTMNAPAQPKPSSVKYNPTTRKIEAA
jgi:hypothetical protein